MKGGSQKRVRVQIEMPEERLEDLDKLLSVTGISTRRELLDTALSMFEWAVDESRAGHLVAAIDAKAGRYAPLRDPALRVAARRAPKERGTVRPR